MPDEHHDRLIKQINVEKERNAKVVSHNERLLRLLANEKAANAIRDLDKQLPLVNPEQVAMIFKPTLVEDADSPDGYTVMFEDEREQVFNLERLRYEIETRHRHLIANARPLCDVPTVEDFQQMRKQQKAAIDVKRRMKKGKNNE